MFNRRNVLVGGFCGLIGSFLPKETKVTNNNRRLFDIGDKVKFENWERNYESLEYELTYEEGIVATISGTDDWSYCIANHRMKNRLQKYPNWDKKRIFTINNTSKGQRNWWSGIPEDAMTLIKEEEKE